MENTPVISEIENAEIFLVKPKINSKLLLKNFSSIPQIENENSKIKSNQIGTFSKYGIIFFYDKKSVFFFNNSNLKTLLEEKESITEQHQFKLDLEEEIAEVCNSEEYLYILHRRGETSVISTFNLEILIQQKIEGQRESFALDCIVNSFTNIGEDEFIILTDNSELSLIKNGQKIKTILTGCLLFKYDAKLKSVATVTNEEITVYSLVNSNVFNKNYSFKINSFIEEDYKIIFVDIVREYLFLYTMKTTEISDDQVYFIEYDSQNKQYNIFYDKEFLFPEIDDNSPKYKNPKAIFAKYNEKLNMYLIFNKQEEVSEKFFTFEENLDSKIEIKSFFPEDEQKISSSFGEIKNPFVGFNIIDFKFQGYEYEDVMVESTSFKSPYLGIVAGYGGGIKIVYMLYNSEDNFPSFIIMNNKYKSVDLKNKVIKCPKEIINKRNVDIKKAKDKSVDIEIDKITEIEEKIKKIKKIDPEELKRKQQELKKEQRNLFLQQFFLCINTYKEMLNDVLLSPQLNSTIKSLNNLINTKSSDFEDKIFEMSNEYMESRQEIFEEINQWNNFTYEKSQSDIRDLFRLAQLLEQRNFFYEDDDNNSESIYDNNEFKKFFNGKNPKTIKAEFEKSQRIYTILKSNYESIKKLNECCIKFIQSTKEISEARKSQREKIQKSKEFKKYEFYNKMLNSPNENIENNQNALVQSTIFLQYMRKFEIFFSDLLGFYYNDLSPKIQKIKDDNKKKDPMEILTFIDEFSILDGNKFPKRENTNRYNSYDMLNKILMNSKCTVTYPIEDGSIDIDGEFAKRNIGKKKEKKDNDNDIEKSFTDTIEKIKQYRDKLKALKKEVIKEENLREKELKKREENLEMRIKQIEKRNEENKKIMDENERKYQKLKNIESNGNKPNIIKKIIQPKKKKVIQSNVPPEKEEDKPKETQILFENKKEEEKPKTQNLFGSNKNDEDKNSIPISNQSQGGGIFGFKNDEDKKSIPISNQSQGGGIFGFKNDGDKNSIPISNQSQGGGIFGFKNDGDKNSIPISNQSQGDIFGFKKEEDKKAIPISSQSQGGIFGFKNDGDKKANQSQGGIFGFKNDGDKKANQSQGGGIFGFKNDEDKKSIPISNQSQGGIFGTKKEEDNNGNQPNISLSFTNLNIDKNLLAPNKEKDVKKDSLFTLLNPNQEQKIKKKEEKKEDKKENVLMFQGGIFGQKNLFQAPNNSNKDNIFLKQTTSNIFSSQSVLMPSQPQSQQPSTFSLPINKTVTTTTVVTSSNAKEINQNKIMDNIGFGKHASLGESNNLKIDNFSSLNKTPFGAVSFGFNAKKSDNFSSFASFGNSGGFFGDKSNNTNQQQNNTNNFFLNSNKGNNQQPKKNIREDGNYW